MATSKPAREQLAAQGADIQRQLAELDLEPTKALQAILNKASVKTLISDIEAAVASLDQSSTSAVQAQNILTVLRAVPGIVDAEVSRLESAAAPPPAPEPAAE